MKSACRALTALVAGLGGLALTPLDADAQYRPGPPRVVPRVAPPAFRPGPPPIVYRRPVPRYYYAAPLLAAPAIVYYSGGSRRYTCDELEYKCDKGGEWACRILERDPNC